jgi:hypothetical protein
MEAHRREVGNLRQQFLDLFQVRIQLGDPMAFQQLLPSLFQNRLRQPQPAGQRVVAGERQAMPVGHGGEEQVQQQGLTRHIVALLAQEAAIHPGPARRGRTPQSLGKQKLFLDHAGDSCGTNAMKPIKHFVPSYAACRARLPPADRRSLRVGFTGAGLVRASRPRCSVAVWTAVLGQPRTPAGGPGGLGKCLAAATYVRAPAPCEPLDGRRGHRSTPAAAPTGGVEHNIPAGRTQVAATTLLLRDNASPQRRRDSALGKIGRAVGARAEPRHPWLWPLPRDAVEPAAGLPASDGPHVGSQHPGSSAGSNAVAGTCAHNLGAGRSAPAGGANGRGDGIVAYHDGNPRERDLPRDSPGGTRKRSPRALITTGKQRAVGQSSRSGRNQTGKETT